MGNCKEFFEADPIRMQEVEVYSQGIIDLSDVVDLEVELQKLKENE